MSIISKGKEPANVKKRINALFSKFNETYPNKVIVALEKDHKKWAETAREISQQLGYENKNDFLTAYGYKVKNSECGRPKATDPMTIIKAMQKKYSSGSPFKTADELFADNPEYLPKLKTVKNLSNEVFGMSLGKYLLSIGLIQPRIASKTKKNYIICKVLPTAVKNPIYCIATSKSIHVGDNVEIPMGICNSLAFASVQEVINCDKGSAPCDVDAVKKISRKLGVREYTAGLIASILRANAAIGTDKLIGNSSVKDFSATNIPEVKAEGNVVWACCRGLAAEMISLLDYLIEKDNQVYEYNDLILINEGVSELYIFRDDVPDVMEKYPNVKMAMFLEDNLSGKVNFCYSKSGYSVITDAYTIGECDTKSNSRWTLRNSPTEDFCTNDIEYTFRFKDDWESLNYVFTDENRTVKQLGKRGK